MILWLPVVNLPTGEFFFLKKNPCILTFMIYTDMQMYTDYTVDGSDLFLQPLLGIRRVIQLEVLLQFLCLPTFF